MEEKVLYRDEGKEDFWRNILKKWLIGCGVITIIFVLYFGIDFVTYHLEKYNEALEHYQSHKDKYCWLCESVKGVSGRSGYLLSKFRTTAFLEGAVKCLIPGAVIYLVVIALAVQYGNSLCITNKRVCCSGALSRVELPISAITSTKVCNFIGYISISSTTGRIVLLFMPNAYKIQSVIAECWPMVPEKQ